VLYIAPEEEHKKVQEAEDCNEVGKQVRITFPKRIPVNSEKYSKRKGEKHPGYRRTATSS